MSSRFKNTLLYGRLTKSEYEAIRDDIAESNRKSVVLFSTIVCILLLVMTVLATLDNVGVAGLSDYGELIVPYSVGALFLALLVLLNTTTAKKHHVVTHICVILFDMLILAFGISLAMIHSSDLTTIFLACLPAVSFVFCMRPMELIITDILGVGIYAAFGAFLMPADIYPSNMLNVVLVAIVSIVGGTYIMSIKIRKFDSDRKVKYLLETDDLTGILNRRSYEKMLETLRRNPDNLVVAAFDINGLKSMNDSLGHAAGDMLIKFASQSIALVFSKYGYCFRTGGDEFMALLSVNDVLIDDLRKEFDEELKLKSRETGIEISVSFGIISASEHPEMSVDELVRSADRLMYKNKSDYYTSSGRDRRRR